MKLSSADLRGLAELAIQAATEAGQMIARSRPQVVQHKAGGGGLASQVVTEVDRRSEDIILDILTPTLERFELGLLTEEEEDDGGRLTADHFWCIDPLDGTLPFVEGTPGYAVSIALVDRGGTPKIGVIHDPVEDALLHAISGFGAFRDRRPWPKEAQPRGAVLSVFADRSFLAADDHDMVLDALDELVRDLGLSRLQLHTTAGAVMNAWGVLAAPPACYFKHPTSSGGGSLWDFAATACLFHEVGAVATDISGSPLDLNRADSTFMNHRGVLFATDQALAQRIRSIDRGLW
ncbi:MAG: inositol monophosphatase family protein [Acidimicrobiia bacterium]|nr:inositol monophosphatase family protein [Acidimicrobiia bacterium]